MAALSLVWDLIAVDNASPAFRRAGDSAAAADGMVKGLLKTLGPLALGAALVESAKAAASFQSEMLLIQTQAGDTSDNLQQMSQAVLSLAGQTAQAPEALATSLYHVVSTGARGQEALNEVAAAAKLATVSHSDLEDTTNALTAAVLAGLPGVHSMDQAIGALNATVGSGDMHMSDLNEALGTGVLAAAKGFGLSMQDVGAALDVFGDNNIRGADAATKLRMSIQDLAKPAATGQKYLDEIGIKAGQLAKDMQTGGLNKAITDLRDHLQAAGVQGNQMGEFLQNAFTKKAGVGLATLLNQYDLLESKYGIINKATGDFGSAWEKTTHTAQFAFTSLRDSIEAIGIQVGAKLLPPLAAAAQKVAGLFTGAGNNSWLKGIGADLAATFTDLKKTLGDFWADNEQDIIAGARDVADAVKAVFDRLKDLVDWVDQHKTIVESLAAAFLTLYTSIKLMLIVKEVAAAIQAAWALLEANPVIAAVSAVAALAAGLIYAYKHSETFRDVIHTVLRDVGGFFQAVWTGAIKPVITGLESAWNHTWAAIRTVWDAARPTIETVGKVVYAVIGGVVLLWLEAAKLYWKVLWDFVKAYWDDYAHPVFTAVAAVVTWLWQDVIQPSWALIRAEWGLLWGAVQAAWDTVGHPVFDAVVTVVQGTWGILSPVFDMIGQHWSDLWGGMQAAFTFIWGGIQRGIVDGVNGIITVLNGFIAGINWVLDKLPGGFKIGMIALVNSDTYIGSVNDSAPAYSHPQGRQAFASGGYTGDGDRFEPAGVVHRGEFVFPQEAVRRLGVGNLGRLAGLPGYDGGGIVGAVTGGLSAAWHGITSLGSDVVGLISVGVQSAIDGVLDAVETPVRAALSAVPSEMARDVLTGAFGSLDSFLRHLVAGQATQAQQQASTVAAGDHAGLITQALQLAGVDVTAPNINAVNVIVSNESGWNPRAINLTDVNAQRGDPSRGLMQTIMSTFEAYRLGGLPDDIYNPLANLVAGIRYAVANYGSLPNVPGVRMTAVGGHYVGYRDGTDYVPQDGLAMLHKGEQIVPADKQGAAWTGDDGRPVTVVLTDADGVLLGSMRGVVDRAGRAGRLAASAGVSRAVVQ